MIIKVAGHEYCVTNTTKKRTGKSQSLGSLADFNIEIDKTRIDTEYAANNNTSEIKCKNRENDENKTTPDETKAEGNSHAEKEVCCIKPNSDAKSKSKKETNATNQTKKEGDKLLLKPDAQKNKVAKSNVVRRSSSRESNNRRKHSTVNAEQNASNKPRNGPCVDDSKQSKQSYALAKSKSEGNPFQHKKKGKIIRITQRPTALGNLLSYCTIFSILYILLHRFVISYPWLFNILFLCVLF